MLAIMFVSNTKSAIFFSNYSLKKVLRRSLSSDSPPAIKWESSPMNNCNCKIWINLQYCFELENGDIIFGNWKSHKKRKRLAIYKIVGTYLVKGSTWQCFCRIVTHITTFSIGRPPTFDDVIINVMNRNWYCCRTTLT